MGDFDQCVAFLATTLRHPQAHAYIHCRAGRKRAAAILIAWYARQAGLSCEQSLRQLQRKRPVLALLPQQEQATRRWLESAR